MFRPRISAVAIACFATACSSAANQMEQSAGTVGDPCVPIETRAANAPDQQPAFAGQTRTCGAKSDVAFVVTVVARGLEKPWSVEPLPTGELLVTEKPGRMRIVTQSGSVGQPITGVPAVDARDQGGL